MMMSFVIGVATIHHQKVGTVEDNAPKVLWTITEPETYSFEPNTLAVEKGGDVINFEYQPSKDVGASTVAYEYTFANLMNDEMAINLKSIDTTDVYVSYHISQTKLDKTKVTATSSEYTLQKLAGNGGRIYIYIIVSPKNESIPASFTTSVVWYQGVRGAVTYSIVGAETPTTIKQEIVKGQTLNPPKMEVADGYKLVYYADVENTQEIDIKTYCASGGNIFVTVEKSGFDSSWFKLSDDGTYYTLIRGGTSFEEFPTELEIPSTYNDIPVKRIGVGAFGNTLPYTATSTVPNTYLTKVIIPDSIEVIDACAFAYCTNLTSVVLSPNSQLTTIGNYAFQNCTKLTLTLPTSVTSVGLGIDGVNMYIREINSVWLYSSLTAGNNYFMGNDAINAMKRGDGVALSISKVGYGAIGDDLNNAVRLTYLFMGEDIGYAIVRAEPYYTIFSATIPATFNDGIHGEYPITKIWGKAFGDALYVGGSTGLSFEDKEYYWVLADGTGTNKMNAQNSTNITSCLIANKYSYFWEKSNELIPSSLIYMYASDANGGFYTVTGLGYNTSTKIIIPETYNNGTNGLLPVKSISSTVFNNNTTITEVIIPASVTTIGSSAFTSCTSLTKVTFAEGSQLTSIPAYVFQYCSKLSDITLPPNIQSIGMFAFTNCNLSGTITIPASVTNISTSAFYSCTNLTRIVFEDTGYWWQAGEEYIRVTNPKTNASGLKQYPLIGTVGAVLNWVKTNYTIDQNPAVQTNLDEDWYEYDEAGYYKVVKGAAISDLDVEISHRYQKGSNPEAPVKVITAEAFKETNITSVRISKNVETIESMAFACCNGLNSITIPENTVTIGYGAFGACENLKTLTFAGVNVAAGTFPSKITTIGDYAFSETGLTSFTILPSLTTIGEGAFAGSSLLTVSPVAASTLKLSTVGDYAFADCTALSTASLSFYGGLQSVGKYAFSGCTSLTSASFGMINSVTELSEGVFNWCEKLTTVTLGNTTMSSPTITTIGKEAFYGCKALTNFSIPTSVTTIRESAFYGCKALANITIPASVTSIESGAFGSSGLVLISFAAQLTTISDRTFASCSSLTSIIIPASVTTIQEQAFASCEKLTTITFAANSQVTTIGERAFAYCYALQSVTIPASVTEIIGSFRYCNALTSVTFEDTGYYWKESGIKIDVSNPTANATKLKLSTASTWTKTDEESYVLINDAAFYTGGMGYWIFNPAAGELPSKNIEIPATFTSGYVVILSASYTFPADCGVERIKFSTSLTALTIPANMFKDCTTLISFEVGATSLTINDNAFKGCTNLESITNINGETITLTSVGDNAFDGCTKLTKIGDTDIQPASQVDVTSSPVSMGRYNVYSGNNNIINVGNVGNYAFRNCNSLDAHFNISGTTGEYAFTGSGVTGVTFTDTVIGIGSNAFQDATSLKNVTIPASVISIGSGAFVGCNALTSVVFEDTESAWKQNGNEIDVSDPSANAEHLKNQDNNAGWTSGAYIFINEDGGYYAVVENPDKSSTEVVIPATYNGYPVKAIADNAFKDSNITSITIPSSVISIGNNAFRNCTSLVSLSGVGVGFSVIGDYAFAGCTSLTSASFVMSGCMKTVGEGAFYGCESLTLVSLGTTGTLEIINDYTFYGCRSLTYVGFANSGLVPTLKTIGNYAFYGCESLASIAIPTSVTTIGDSAFQNCTKLASITIPAGVTTIGSYAFAGNELMSITFSTADYYAVLTKNGSNTVYLAVTNTEGFALNLTSTYAEYTWSLDPTYTNLDESWYEYDSSLGGYRVIKGNSLGSSTRIVVASRYKKGENPEADVLEIYNATSYSAGVFYNQGKITEIYLPVKLQTIGANAFRECSDLARIDLPNTLTSIGDYAFQSCFDLISIVIPNSVTTLGNYVFCACSNLSEVIIGENSQLNNMGIYIFYQCRSLRTITIPKSLSKIGNYSFYNCISLESVSFATDGQLTTIGSGAFNNCTSLTSITIPASVTSVDTTAWGYCTNLETIVVDSNNTTYDSRDNCNAIIKTATNELVCGFKTTTIPNTVVSLGTNSFYYIGITSLTIPASVRSIATYAIKDNGSLQTITVDSANTIYDSRDNCNAIIQTGINSLVKGSNSTIIPNSVTSIGVHAFIGSGITSITIPDSVTSIGVHAFSGCTRLTSITIPNSVTAISNYVFKGCTNLTSVIISDSVTSIGEQAFNGCSKLTSITIPSSVATIGRNAFQNSGLTNAIFEATSGWMRTSSASSAGSSVDVSDASTAATFLKSMYVSDFWYNTDKGGSYTQYA